MIEIAGKQNDMSINRLNISDGEKLDLEEFVKEFGLKIPNANDDNDTASTVNSDDSSNDSSCNTTDKMRTSRGYDVDTFTPSSPQGYDVDNYTPDDRGYDVDSFTDISPQVKSNTNLFTQKCSLHAHLTCNRMIPRDEDEDIDSIMPNIRKVKESIMPPLSNKLPTLNENEILACTIRNEAKRILAAVRESEERKNRIKRRQDVSDQGFSVRDIDVKPKKHYSRWLKMSPEELRTEAKRILEAVDNIQASCVQNIVHERNPSIPEDNNPSTGRLNPVGSRFLQIESTGWFARSSGWI